MARSNNNIIVHGLSGKLGASVVFVQRAGKTIVRKSPTKSKVPPTASQQQQRLLFKDAVQYAKRVKATPALAALYQPFAQIGKSVYHMAIADAMFPPNIQNVNLLHYTGKVNDVIILQVTDNFMVKSVGVTIVTPGGISLETGFATQQHNDIWVYQATITNNQYLNSMVIIRAIDFPGNLCQVQHPVHEP
jgi:hypothetical protein